MYSSTDILVAVVSSLMVGLFVGMAIMKAKIESDMGKERQEFRATIKSYQRCLDEKNRIITEKNKHIVRFKYKVIDAVQQYLQHDAVACTMIIATINGIKEGKENAE